MWVMISRWFKKHFIPHAGNDHRPHFLHGRNARRIVLLVLAAELILFVLPALLIFRGFDSIASVLPGVLNSFTNEKRVAADLPELGTSEFLTRAAELKAEDMATKGYFAHNSPEGLTPWHWLSRVGYRYAMAGENLAVNFSDSRDVTEAWMNSPAHRDNILKHGFTEVGTAVAVGQFQGREAIFVVQYYGKSAPTPPPPTMPLPLPRTVTQVEQPRPLPSRTPPAQTVLGEESEREEVPVVEVPEEILVAEITEAPVVPATIEISRSSAIERAVTSPRHTANLILGAILTLVALAIGINMMTKVSRRQPDLVTNGLAVAAIILGIYLANIYIFSTDPVITSEVAFVSEAIF
jgi:hypothetical protein